MMGKALEKIINPENRPKLYQFSLYINIVFIVTTKFYSSNTSFKDKILSHMFNNSLETFNNNFYWLAIYPTYNLALGK